MLGSAPGKLVLSGEYAVLLGAAALVTTVDRLATCFLKEQSEGNWCVRAEPLSESLSFISDSPPENDSILSRLITTMWQKKPDIAHARLLLDTIPFYRNGEKLGMGSSAAIVVAASLVFDQLMSKTSSFEELAKTHNQLQRSRGSGLDIAACMEGGTIAFRSHTFSTVSLDPGLKFSFIATQKSASTSTMVEKFREWEKRGDSGLSREWVEVADRVVDRCNDSVEFLEELGVFVKLLKRVDEESGLGIFSDEHLEISRIANQRGVVYKPSGAGGGDMGVAFSDDAEKLNAFESRIPARVIERLNLTNRGGELQIY